MHDIKHLFINDNTVWNILEDGQKLSDRLPRILEKAARADGLEPIEVACLLNITDPEIWEQIFKLASEVKSKIYGNRIVIFAPLYLSNYCINSCVYCGYHAKSGIHRRRLTQAEIIKEVEALEDLGHKRIAVETGEDPENCPLDYVLESIKTIYQTRYKRGNIRRINVNIAATTVDDYQKLKEAGIGTYILFQETYHRASYEKYHPSGPKHNYLWHLNAFDRAMAAGIDDVGAGVLFGLYDFRYELIALLLHSQHLEANFGVGPHTVSVPRLRQASGVQLNNFPYLVSDADFKKIVALIRLALPYTGIILSTRENADFRREIINLGVSQISAGSCTGVGGYSKEFQKDSQPTNQFEVGDHRAPDTILNELCQDGYLPSFCTACYRQGRTGDRFMELAKSGTIGKVCTPNAILTFQEFLEDYASPETRIIGAQQIENSINSITDQHLQQELHSKLERIKAGERDLYY
ncbi:MAG TPA: [FeFe] hydrogenase H-cluster radical SAM maturase HydG [Bacillota bacterium]|jgi:2-iminoacetate synthase|nr:[FeFe] hydrogenase H-cluster radical SAM maturase HydG [Bacillota bacterium]HOL09697.1 [FeFe] hydrogenase H-cluster radical SAM maturase HydG [Bacillota bacterium]HPO97286.1 [FeFe] hydrogenase H-cluster radical SAM maturase HydG [Bacillota bacterium]